MRKGLLAGLCGLVLLAAITGQAVGQENRTQDKSVGEKTADDEGPRAPKNSNPIGESFARC